MNTAREALNMCAMHMQIELASRGEVFLLVSFTKQPYDEKVWLSQRTLTNELPNGCQSHPHLPTFQYFGGTLLYDRIFANCWLEDSGRGIDGPFWIHPYLDQAIRAAEAARTMRPEVVAMHGMLRSGVPWSYNLALWLLTKYGTAGMNSAYRVYTTDGLCVRPLEHLAECDMVIYRPFYLSALYAKWLAEQSGAQRPKDLPSGLTAAVIRAVFVLTRDGRGDECQASGISRFLNSPDSGPLTCTNGGRSSVSRAATTLAKKGLLTKEKARSLYQLTAKGADVARILLDG